MKRLPPLTGIEAFVQVARTGSVKAAAASLALSSPALTRRVQALERFVGRTLFERRHQGVHLNPDGERLLSELGPALDALARAFDRATGAGDVQRLRLGVLPLFASYRLMPRMAALRALHPELHIDIDTGPHGLARLDEGLDAAIVLTRDVEAPLYARPLARSPVVAIGAPHMRDVYRAPADLSRATVFLHRDLPDAFDYWREAAGAPGLEPAAIDHFDSGQLILDAAAQGLGVAFMFEMHLEVPHDPPVVRLFDAAVDIPYTYWFACRQSALKRRPVKLFHDWLVAELG